MGWRRGGAGGAGMAFFQRERELWPGLGYALGGWEIRSGLLVGLGLGSETFVVGCRSCVDQMVDGLIAAFLSPATCVSTHRA
jgi:hypothetical protein